MCLDLCIYLNRVTFDINIFESYLLTFTDSSAQGHVRAAWKTCRNVIYNRMSAARHCSALFRAATSPCRQEHVGKSHLSFTRKLTRLLIESNSQEYTLPDGFSVCNVLLWKSVSIKWFLKKKKVLALKQNSIIGRVVLGCLSLHIC